MRRYEWTDRRGASQDRQKPRRPIPLRLTHLDAGVVLEVVPDWTLALQLARGQLLGGRPLWAHAGMAVPGTWKAEQAAGLVGTGVVPWGWEVRGGAEGHPFIII